MNREQIAQVAHEVNRAYCAALGDTTQALWADAPEWQRASALAGVDMHLANPDATPEQSHESWLAQKTADGWKHGPVKDAEKKEHPCFCPYADLPAEQKAKDYLFRGVVHVLAAMAPEAPSAPAPAASQPVAAVGVKYIGRRETHADTLYGSGAWARDQVKAVSPGLARQLLKHRDVFEEVQLPGTAQPAAVVQAQKPGETPDELSQELRDQVQNMDKAALREFAQTRYRVKVDGRLSLPDTRAHVTQLIDRFGAS